MKIFWDANALVDLVDQSRPGHTDALLILKDTRKRAAGNLISWHTLSILSYLCSKKFGKGATDEIIQELLKVFKIPVNGSKKADRALGYNASDFEDALQISAAVAAYADYIVTLDTKGFSKSPIPVVTPAEMLCLLRDK
ncbi:MAG: PIN domain-containing protein [Symploca sp. SIO2E6]|nr:PIN domain-containing protein [Symploca sp. SIO2E6]